MMGCSMDVPSKLKPVIISALTCGNQRGSCRGTFSSHAQQNFDYFGLSCKSTCMHSCYSSPNACPCINQPRSLVELNISTTNAYYRPGAPTIPPRKDTHTRLKHEFSQHFDISVPFDEIEIDSAAKSQACNQTFESGGAIYMSQDWRLAW